MQRTGSISGEGQLSLRTTAAEPLCLEPVPHKGSHCREQQVHLNKEEPPLATTRESPCTAIKTQDAQK